MATSRAMAALVPLEAAAVLLVALAWPGGLQTCTPERIAATL